MDASPSCGAGAGENAFQVSSPPFHILTPFTTDILRSERCKMFEIIKGKDHCNVKMSIALVSICVLLYSTDNKPNDVASPKCCDDLCTDLSPCRSHKSLGTFKLKCSSTRNDIGECPDGAFKGSVSELTVPSSGTSNMSLITAHASQTTWISTKIHNLEPITRSSDHDPLHIGIAFLITFHFLFLIIILFCFRATGSSRVAAATRDVTVDIVAASSEVFEVDVYIPQNM